MTVFAQLAAVTIRSTGDDDQAIRNTFHVVNTTDDFDNGAILASLAEDVYNYFKVTYRAMLTDGMTYDGVTAAQVVVPTDPGEYISEEFTDPVAGTRTGGATACPQEICAVLSLRTAIASRRFRGHMFLPPARLIAALDGEKFATGNAYWTAVQNYRSTFETGLAAVGTWTGTTLANCALVCYSARAAEVSAPAVQANVGAVVTTNRAHWLRSRGRGTT